MPDGKITVPAPLIEPLNAAAVAPLPNCSVAPDATLHDPAQVSAGPVIRDEQNSTIGLHRTSIVEDNRTSHTAAAGARAASLLERARITERRRTAVPFDRTVVLVIPRRTRLVVEHCRVQHEEFAAVPGSRLGVINGAG